MGALEMHVGQANPYTERTSPDRIERIGEEHEPTRLKQVFQ
jgi:hypothetical protein